MPEDSPLSLEQVLADEYQALRPDEGHAVAGRDAIYRKLHASKRPLAALCISGGGIRSATFALGVLQGLARHRILERFDYLSTVSGGGYIGSWLSAWMTRAGGLASVIPRLRPDAPAPAEDEPDPVAHLRAYNNYLTPRLGFLSADSWTLGATVARNIVLNWLVLVPLLIFALLVPRLVLSLLAIDDYFDVVLGEAQTIALIRDSRLVVYSVPAMAALLFAYTVFNVARFLPSVGGRAHSQNDFLRHCLAPLLGAVLLFLTYDALHFWADLDQINQQTPFLDVVSWTLVPCVAGWLVFLLFCGKPLKTRFGLLFGRLSVAVLLTGVSTGTAAWLLTNLLFPKQEWAVYATVAPPLLLLSVDIALGVFVGFTSNTLKDGDREWFARATAWHLLSSAAWLAACSLVLLVPAYALVLTDWDVWGSSALAAVGAASGWASTLPGTAAGTEPGVRPNPVVTMAKSLAVKLAPVVFLVSLSIGLTLLTNRVIQKSGTLPSPPEAPGGIAWTDHELLLDYTPIWLLFGLAAAVLAFGALMARYINVNRFSLHAMYRNRLIRAYPGASNPVRCAATANDGEPRPGQSATFTGFLQSDNLAMHELKRAGAPLHVVNVALNLVSGDRLAWQQRKAQSFSISPLHCGNHELGYRPSARYGGPDGISLGTALSISGAAASPSMGYHSSPVIGFIMTLFNARLGSWLGNPGTAGAKTWRHAGPRSAVASLVKEALGLTDNRSAYVYLSDGGHFENLALYEMVLRRCRFIVVLDGGCDPQFTYEDLGNAMRKIRIDLRVPISFKEPRVSGLRAGTRRCAIGRIHYSSVDGDCEDGWLLYVKPMRLGNEPPDVSAYWRANQSFPHQSTSDQWFDESQTESYRMLGLHTVEEICEGWDAGEVPEDFVRFYRHVEQKYLQAVPAQSDPAE